MGALGAQCLTSKEVAKTLLPDLSNLDEISAKAPEQIRWQETWNKPYPKSMWQTKTPPRGGAQDSNDKRLRETIEQEAERLFIKKATPHPHQYRMVIRHCRPDRTL